MAVRDSRPELMNPAWEAPGTRAAPVGVYPVVAQTILLLLTVVFFVGGMNNVYLAQASGGTALNNVDGAWRWMTDAAVFGGAFILVFLADLVRRRSASD